MPLVSIVIPTYNRAEFVTQAIESALKQSFDDIEVIVIDDGSTDSTFEVLKKYGTKIKVFRQSRKGVSFARNRGIAESMGEYVAFLDSDDIFYKRKLEIQMNLIKSKKDCDICYSNERWLLNGEHKNQHPKHKKYSGWIFEKTLPLCIVSPSSALINKKVFEKCGGFDESFIVCEDYELWMRLSLHYPFHFIDKPLVIKRGGHPDQLSHKYWGMDRFRIRALKKTLTTQTLSDFQRELLETEITKKCRVLYNGALKRGKLKVSNYYKMLEEKYLKHEILADSHT